MRVAIVTKYFAPIKGGIETHCYNLAKELFRKNVYVEIHTSYLNNVDVFEVIDGIKVFRHKRFWFSLPVGYDIVHLHNFNIFPHMIILVKVFLNRLFKRGAAKTFLILTPHGGYVPWWEGFKPYKRVIKKILHKSIGKFFLNRVVDKIIALTEDEYKQLIEEGIDYRKIVIIPNGVEEEAFTYPKATCSDLKMVEKDKPYLLFLGRVDPRKNIEFVIKNLINEVSFVIAGPIQDLNYYNYLSNLISKLGFQNRVLFLGEVGKELKYKLIDCALAVCLISHMETEPIIIKESIVRGTPVIISKKIRLPRILFKKYESMIFIVDSNEDFLFAVKNLLGRKKERVYEDAGMDEEGTRFWRWSCIADKIKSVYEGLLNEK